MECQPKRSLSLDVVYLFQKGQKGFHWIIEQPRSCICCQHLKLAKLKVILVLKFSRDEGHWHSIILSSHHHSIHVGSMRNNGCISHNKDKVGHIPGSALLFLEQHSFQPITAFRFGRVVLKCSGLLKWRGIHLFLVQYKLYSKSIWYLNYFWFKDIWDNI